MRNQLVSILALLLVTVGVQTAKADQVPDDMAQWQLVNSYTQTTWDGFSLWDGESMMDYQTDEGGWVHITNAAQLAKYAYDLFLDANVGNKSIYLECDIDLGDHTFSIARASGNSFGKGETDDGYMYQANNGRIVFDGGGHIIRNGQAVAHDTYAGLFGEICYAVVKDLIVDNYTVNVGNSPTGCGVICGFANKAIQITENDQHTELIRNDVYCEINNCRVMNCSVNGDIKNAGGMVGEGFCSFNGNSVINCTINTTQDKAGGIAGALYTRELNEIVAKQNRVIYCTISGEDDYAGGLVGYGEGNFSFESNYVLGSSVRITNGDGVGGLVGRLDDITVALPWFDRTYKLINNWIDAKVTGNDGANKGAVIGSFNEEIQDFQKNYWNGDKCNLSPVGDPVVNDLKAFSSKTTAQLCDLQLEGFTKWDHVLPCLPDNTSGDIVVTTAAQLREISDRVKKGYTYEGRTIRLANDINVSNGDVNWEPIGCASADNSQIHPFMGRFDGQGHTISGLTTTGTSYDYRGLFGLVINAHISNVQINGPNISTNGKYVGGAVGWVYGGSCYVGQVMVNNATITARSSAGGVMGRSSNDAYSTIEDCQVLGTVRASQDDNDTGADGWSGGIVGNMHYGQITDCGSTAEIHGKKTGLVGGCERAIAITRCYAVSYNNTNLVSVGMNKATITDCPSAVSTGEGMKSTLGDSKWYYFSNGDRHPIPSALAIYVDDTGIVVQNGVVYQPEYSGNDITNYLVIGYQGSGGNVVVADEINNHPVDWVLSKAFKGNETITSITIGNNVKVVRFADIPNLQSITLGAKVGESSNPSSYNYERDLIRNCPKLTTISVNENNTHLVVVDGLLYHKWRSVADGNIYAWELLRCPVDKAGELTLPSTITKSNETLNMDVVSVLAFEDCNLLTGIVMPETLMEGEYNASPFKNNTALQYLDMRTCPWRENKVGFQWYTNRSEDASGFFARLPESTLIYLPAGDQVQQGYEHNVIIGSQAQGEQPVTLTDGEDFCPKTDFTAPHGVTNSRVLMPYAEQVDESIVTTPRGYTVCLPYALTLSGDGVKVYAPSTSSVVAGVTTITFQEVEGGTMVANKPYYVVVRKGIDLSTNESVSFTAGQTGDTNSGEVSDFVFKGTLVKIPNEQLYDAQKPAYILQSDGKWHKVPQNQPLAYVGPYRAYFQAASPSAARSLNMVIDDEGTTGLQQIHTIDADGTERCYDLNGRQIANGQKPTAKGLYIVNGKKYINK